MSGVEVDNSRVLEIKPLISPELLREEIPGDTDPKVYATVLQGRASCEQVISGVDDRLLVIVGPCSIHDPKAALEYAHLLLPCIEKHSKDLLIVMRVYFEKPRTSVGWKGLINDPFLNGTFKINQGLKLARTLLRDINQLGIPCGCELLDTISPQFISDLYSWGAIGARTTESQIHRELASGISCPIGFKNGTDGNVQIAIDAMKAAAAPHHFLGVTRQGLAGIVHTTGNAHTHVILRGSNVGPNYSSKHVTEIVAKLTASNCNHRIMIDCSHGNSSKLHTNQPIVAADIVCQMASGEESIIGVMIESNLKAGRQDIPASGPARLEYGKSVTDACIDFETTVGVFDVLAEGVRKRREARSKARTGAQ